MEYEREMVALTDRDYKRLFYLALCILGLFCVTTQLVHSIGSTELYMSQLRSISSKDTVWFPQQHDDNEEEGDNEDDDNYSNDTNKPQQNPSPDKDPLLE